MLPELGLIALVCAFVTAVVLAGAGLAGAPVLARRAAHVQLAFVGIAFGVLAWSFAQGDFSIKYVAQHSNSRLPLQYRLAAVWGGHEGSLLLWVLILCGWTGAVAAGSRRLPGLFAARVLGAMGAIAVGFLAFTLFASNPFERLLPAAPDGRDLNPLLQDPGMVFHPPLLYMGYVGFTVAFAFAIAALAGGRLDAQWARWARPWTVCAWVFLTLGIALGSFWAYYELGWGGWWFWDPVENASFMPWLLGTALVHSLVVTEKRGALAAWTALLAIGAFALSLLGTFLVRSGVLTSVHAFATDPKRGIFILVFLALVVGGSLALFAARGHRLAAGGAAPFEPVSREAMLLGNNVLLLVAAASVGLGTLYPLALDALGAGKISVGPPYFESVFVPVIAPVLFLMGVGPLAAWKRARLPELGARLKWAAAVSLGAAVALPFAAGWRPMVALGLFLAFWIAASTAAGWLERRRARNVPLSYYGMVLAHLGMAVFIAGVTLVKAYETTEELRMAVGDSARLAGYDFRLASIEEVKGPNYVAARGAVEVSRNDAPVATLHPEKRAYPAQSMPMTEAALDMGLLRHLYVALGEPLSEREWVLRLQHKPFVGWIWLGALLMAAGGLLAAAKRSTP